MNIIMKTCMRNNIHKRSLRSQCLARIDVSISIWLFHDLLPVKLITVFILTGHLCLLVHLQTLPLHYSLESLHHPM